jgi:hypothetical protein
MQKAELNTVLQELYSWDPKLKKREKELIDLINKMIESIPDTKFDASFAESLKQNLMSQEILLNNNDKPIRNYLLFNFKNMNRKLYAITGSVAIVGVVALFLIVNKIPVNKINKSSLVKNASSVQIVKSNPGAFGALKTLSTSGNAASVGQESALKTSGAGGAGMAVATAPTNFAARTMDSASSKMIVAPMYSYKFEYKGDPLELKEETGTVYRRIKGDGSLSSNLNSLIGTETFGPINLNSFSNLKTGNISLFEDKKLGLNINIDFNEENIYIGENWQKWQSGRDNCGDNQACWDSFRLKITDIPDDGKLITMANNFISDHNINLEHYGEAVVDNNWRSGYEIAENKNDFYVPEYSNLVYPLIVNDQKVYDQSGNLDGLRVTINLLQNAVSSVSNLMPYRYETSDYPLETNSDKILGLAVKGNTIYYYNNGGQKEITLELGTPTKSLIRYYRYTNNINEELLVPALIFPVNNAPANYYGSKFITIPLVKEMADELYNNGSTGGGGGIMPMMR